jgi:hypothetical protein
MADFLQRFGQRDADGDEYHFSNVRSGLIVGLVSVFKAFNDIHLQVPAIYWNVDGGFDCWSSRRSNWEKVVNLSLVYHPSRWFDSANIRT